MHSKDPLFSILVAHYNNGHFFKDCFKSIISQTYQNWEVIIVDDYSSDNSLEIIKGLINDDKRFQLYFNKKNRGVGFTKNKCIELSNGEICGFVDPDDVIDIYALQEMIDTHFKNPKCSLVYSNLYNCNDTLEIISNVKREQIQNKNLDFFNIDGSISHFVTFKKDYYKFTEGIDTYLQIAEDQDLYLKLYEVGDVYHLDKSLYYYRIHDNNISLGRNRSKAYYWHWYVIMQAAKRRNIDVEYLFNMFYIKRSEYEILNEKIRSLQKSKIYILLKKTGIYKYVKFF